MFALLVLLGIAGLVAVDQVTKALAVLFLQDEPVAVWDGVFDLTYVENRGAAFGLGQGYGWLFAVLTVILSLGILGLLFGTRRFRHPLAVASGMLIVAGGVGNLIDRVWRGFVVDFFYFKWIDFPVFNVADCCVVIGAILLAVYVLFVYREPEAERVPAGGEEDAATAQAGAGDGGQIAGTNGQISTGAAAEEQRIPDGSAAAITIDDRTGEAGRAKEARANGASDADRAGGGGGDEA